MSAKGVEPLICRFKQTYPATMLRPSTNENAKIHFLQHKNNNYQKFSIDVGAWPAARAPGLARRLLVCASLAYPALRAPGLARRLLVCASLPYPALRAPGLAWRLLVCASLAYPALRAPLPMEGETCHRMAGACHAARKEQVRRTSFPFVKI